MIKIDRPALPVIAFPIDDAKSRLQFRGEYLQPPPTAALTAGWVSRIVDPSNQTFLPGGAQVFRLAAGDFDSNSWAGCSGLKYH